MAGHETKPRPAAVSQAGGSLAGSPVLVTFTRGIRSTSLNVMSVHAHEIGLFAIVARGDTIKNKASFFVTPNRSQILWFRVDDEF